MKDNIGFQFGIVFLWCFFLLQKGNTQTAVLSMKSMVGEIEFESTDHRSNVYQVVSDRKEIGLGEFKGAILSYSDYYPYGMRVGERSDSGLKYRFGYQGSEHELELKGDGNSHTTFYRQLDVRIGRWNSKDPKITVYESPYLSMASNPIFFYDPLGDEVIYRKGVKGFFQKLRVRINKTFSKSFREKFKKYDEVEIKYHLSKKSDVPRLIDGGITEDYKGENLRDEYKKDNKHWYYSTGLKWPDWDPIKEIKSLKIKLPEIRLPKIKLPKIDLSNIKFPELHWGIGFSAGGSGSGGKDAGLHLLSFGLGDYKYYNSLFLPRGTLGEYGGTGKLRAEQFKPDAFLMISWYTKHGYPNWIGLLPSLKFKNRTIRFQWHKSRSGKIRTYTPWD